MTFWDHLAELRAHLIRIMIALVLCAGASLFFSPFLLKILVRPYGDLLIVIGPTESFSVYMRIALTAGAIIAMPYIIFELWRFISPGLHPRERRYAFAVIPSAVVLFLLGSAFAWFVLIPTAVRFLSGFLPDVFKTQWTSERYYPFVTSLLFWVGVFFELPLVVFVLAKLRIVTAGLLLKGWRVAVVAIVVVAAVITPTVDAFNMMLVALPLAALYFFSILLASLAQRGGGRG
jgi:sec-independent protein translocase protein TatC